MTYLLISTLIAFYLGKLKHNKLAIDSDVSLKSSANSCGLLFVLNAAITHLAVFLGTSNEYIAIATSIITAVTAYFIITPHSNIRKINEQIIYRFLLICSIISVFITIAIVLSILFESFRFFEEINIIDYLFGTHWSPQNYNPDFVEEGSNKVFGIIPVLGGTLLITGVAMLVAVPIGIFAAIYLSEYIGKKYRKFVKPAIEVLGGVPTVVYGYFAALIVAPFLKNHFGADPESAIAAGVVMGIMIIPYIMSLSDDVINAVPQALRDASYGIGATKSETVKNVVVPAALPGITASVLLAISRAIGETMIVVMAAGLVANLTINPLESVTTITTQIVTLLTGDQEFDSAKTLSAFALGLSLFLLTLMLNYFALRVVKKYSEKYE